MAISSFWALPPGWAQSPEGRSERKREPGGTSPFSSPPSESPALKSLHPLRMTPRALREGGRGSQEQTRPERRAGPSWSRPQPLPWLRARGPGTPAAADAATHRARHRPRRPVPQHCGHCQHPHFTDQEAERSGSNSLAQQVRARSRASIAARVRHFSTRFSHPFLPLLSRNQSR